MIPGRIALAIGMLALAGVWPIAPQQPAVFRAGTRTVVVYPTVHDREGRIVPDLTREDFTVLDNGKPAPVTVFSNEIQTITVALLLDMSGSMVPRYLKARSGTLAFIDALLPPDRVRIGSFGSEVSLSPLLTGDKNVLRRIATEELWPGDSTPMWNAIYAAQRSLAGETGRRVILVVTDGVDSGRLDGLDGDDDDVRNVARREGFMVYAIGMEGMEPLQRALVDLVEDTGGGHFHVKVDDDLGSTFARVAEELRRQYVIGFTPLVVDGKEHKLEVRARSGMKVRARKTFVAER